MRPRDFRVTWLLVGDWKIVGTVTAMGAAQAADRARLMLAELAPQWYDLGSPKVEEITAEESAA